MQAVPLLTMEPGDSMPTWLTTEDNAATLRDNALLSSSGSGSASSNLLRPIKLRDGPPSGIPARLPGARFRSSYSPPPSLLPPLLAGSVLHFVVEATNAAGLRNVAWSSGVRLLCGQDYIDPVTSTLQPGSCVSDDLISGWSCVG
jgi:hypothetical protein